MSLIKLIQNNHFLIPFFSAPPITFKTKLRNQQVEEENSITLSCELSKPGLPVEWRKGEELLKNNFKYQIKTRNSIMELIIKNTQLEDSGLYSCKYGDVKTTANITITRKGSLFYSLFYFLCIDEKRFGLKYSLWTS